MKTESVNLRGPTIINDLTRYPNENPITVSEEVADDLRERGLLDEEENLEDLKVDELRKLAADETIDLGDAKSKPDIIAAIRKARADKEA